MGEISRIFEDIKTSEKTFSFAELLTLYRDKTNKQGLSSFYNFIREAQAFKVIEKIKKDSYLFKRKGLDGLQ